MSPDALGLIAGQGRLPYLVADGARAVGCRVICAALADSAEDELAGHVDVFRRCSVARPGSWIRLFRRHGVHEAIMVGRVAKVQLYTPWRIIHYLPDWRAFRIWYGRLRRRDTRNDTLLGAVADELKTGGITVIDSTQYCREHLAGTGLMTRTEPPRTVQEDIEFGWPIAKELGRLDIGQAVAVREREVIAVEAIEGTAAMIERAGDLCRKGKWTLIKVAKPGQDLRFDVPCIGPDTIRDMARYQGACVVLEQGKVLILDKPETLALADSLGIAVLGR